MKGRRLPLGEWPKEPGDYMGPITGYTGDLPAVFFLKPNARDPGVRPIARSIQHVVSPPHTYRECSDGSLEIRASLGDMHDGVSDGWHGYLDEGHVWRKC
jgi:hypothetical protein